MIFSILLYAFFFKGFEYQTYEYGNSGGNISSDSISVIIFLSETCPICQQATPAIHDLFKKYSHLGVQFTGVFPNKGISNPSTIQKFKKKYKLAIEMVYDPDGYWKNELKATITPEIFIIHKNTHQIYYRGRIDNRYVALGKRRSVVTEFYAHDALQYLIEGKIPALAYTEAVGCFIADD
jgi:peroxiredoxin